MEENLGPVALMQVKLPVLARDSEGSASDNNKGGLRRKYGSCYYEKFVGIRCSLRTSG